MRHNSTFRETAGLKEANPMTGHLSGARVGLVVALAVCTVMAGFAAVEPVHPRARLNSISAKASAHGASVVLEASEPVAYVTSRPDPLTVLVDLRNATAAGVLNRVAASPTGPVAAVTVEDAIGSDGSAVARVHVLLASPAQHTVHSERNMIEVDVVPDDASPGVRLAPALSGPAPSLARPAPSPGTAALRAPVPPEQKRDAEAQPAPTVGVIQVSAPQSAPPLSQVATSPAAQLPPQSSAGTARRYTGHPVSLDFQGADLRAVLRTFSEISGLNIVIDPAVQGTVDVALRDVPWDQALDSILRANKLSYAVDGTIVRVAPITVLAEEETSRRKLSEEQALSGEMKVMTKALNYAQAEELAPLLKGNALSSRGTVAVDKRTNTVVINDLPPYLAKAEALLNALDQSEGQVEIEARIVSTSKTFARQLGVKWGFLGQATPELGNTTGASFPNTINGNISINPSGSTTTLPNVASLVLGSVNGSLNLNAALQALENEGHIKVLLQPRIVTQNNVKARIARGQEIPYTTTVAPEQTAGAGVVVQQPMPTVQFKTAALTLEVTPRITPADTVLLQVDVDNGSAGEVQANGNIAINTQRATTTVLVQNGATTVIGGIYSSQQNHTDFRTPGLARIPLLGWLFRSATINDQDEELLIFITPRVMRIK
jgi:type IV pilus assembly protein PilQ